MKWRFFNGTEGEGHSSFFSDFENDIFKDRFIYTTFTGVPISRVATIVTGHDESTNYYAPHFFTYFIFKDGFDSFIRHSLECHISCVATIATGRDESMNYAHLFHQFYLNYRMHKNDE